MSPTVVNPRDIAGNAEVEEEEEGYNDFNQNSQDYKHSADVHLISASKARKSQSLCKLLTV